ncbi:MAG TPA: McrC family protein [Stenotrophobium sp.]|nr:McrC family protein [Stenotrophobium sp.]
METVTVREHARLTTGPVAHADLDQASIPTSAFDWLCHQVQQCRAGGARLLHLEDRRWLKLDNYVGVIETPCGTRIEILPKHTRAPVDVATARAVLVRMLRRCLDLPVRDIGPAAVQAFDAPVSEWIIGQFLSELDALVRRGLRFDYHPVEEEVRFLRGRLQVARQLRQPAGRAHCFQVEHQVFDADRAENRLLCTALDKVASLTRDAGHWRLAHELVHQLAGVPRSHDIAGDFRRWSDGRLMGRYRTIRSWCGLILDDRTPLSALGTWMGRSLLFPMERVYERFVEACLRTRLPAGATLHAQASGQWLCRTSARPLFRLRPDFVIEHAGERCVVDAKWKLLDAADVEHNHGLAQTDFYQLFAYGQRYLAGQGRMALIYPRTEDFGEPLDTFHFDDRLSMDVLPLDLETGNWQGGHLPLADGGSDQA